MKIALLGYGKEGRAAEKYFTEKYKDATFDVIENASPAEIAARDYSSYDIILRSPSIPPFACPHLTSLTRYFFEHCPCPIIGVTATKGKGTTCSFIKSLLDAHGCNAYLVGNIGTPAIEVLDQLTTESVVAYELSSFQLWDLEKSPHISVIGHLEPDHLNVHADYAEYLGAKGNIARFQSATDYCIFYAPNSDSTKLAALSPAQKIPYPFAVPSSILSSITLPGVHNQENAIAAIAAVASYFNISPDEYLSRHADVVKRGLANFHGLPHRLEFLRGLEHVKYYDDNFSTTVSSTRVAVNAFPDQPVTIIIGGRDKTANADLPELYHVLSAPQIKHIVLIGESGHALAEKYTDPRFILAASLEDAVERAHSLAVSLAKPESSAIVLMSPAAASFDMFRDVYDRGEQYRKLVNNL